MNVIVVIKGGFIGAVLTVEVIKTENIDLTTRKKKSEIFNITFKMGD